MLQPSAPRPDLDASVNCARTEEACAAVAAAVDALRNAGALANAPLSAVEANATSTIYRAYRDRLLRIATRMLRSGRDAQDVVHDLFCRLPRLIVQYQGRGFSGWMRRAVISECLMYLRRVRAHRECSLEGAALENVWTPIGNRDDDMHTAIKRLSPSLREVIVMRFFLAYSHHEIASVLDITSAASEVRVCRALKQLRRSLQCSTLCT